MITIQIELSTGIAKPSISPIIKVGGLVPITIQFFMNGVAAAPGSVLSLLEVGLGTDATPPVLLAFTGTFPAQNASTYTGFLDASDTRLATYMATLGTASLNCEVAWTADGDLQIAPNFTVTVQPRVIPGDPTSSGGPTYLTELQSDARYLVGESQIFTSPGGHKFRFSFGDDGTVTPVQIS